MRFILLTLLQVLEIYYYLLIAFALLSWFPQLHNSMIGRWIQSLVCPILRPLSRYPLQFAGLDWTVFIVIILLNVLSDFLWKLLVFL